MRDPSWNLKKENKKKVETMLQNDQRGENTQESE